MIIIKNIEKKICFLEYYCFVLKLILFYYSTCRSPQRQSNNHIEKQTIEIGNKWFVFWKQYNEKTKQAKNKTIFNLQTRTRIGWKQQSNNDYEIKHEQYLLNIELNWFEHFSCWKQKSLQEERNVELIFANW